MNPLAPVITFRLDPPGPASPTASVAVSGAGVAGYSVKVYDFGLAEGDRDGGRRRHVDGDVRASARATIH